MEPSFLIQRDGGQRGAEESSGRRHRRRTGSPDRGRGVGIPDAPLRGHPMSLADEWPSGSPDCSPTKSHPHA